MHSNDNGQLYSATVCVVWAHASDTYFFKSITLSLFMYSVRTWTCQFAVFYAYFMEKNKEMLTVCVNTSCPWSTCKYYD